MTLLSYSDTFEAHPGEILQFVNCRLLRNHRFQSVDLYVQDGKIVDPEQMFFDRKLPSDRQICCDGLLLAPGYIDVQINGGFGVDFSSDELHIQEGLQLVARKLLSTGVTSFCPTVISSARSFYRKVLPLIKRSEGSVDGASVLGVHLEGPFINVERKGAHPPDHLTAAATVGVENLFDFYGQLDQVSYVTLAPELPNSAQTIRQLVERGVKVSIGHSVASISQGEEAVQNGATCVTHLFNAMLPFHHRDPGLVGLLASSKIPVGQKLFFGIIADGIHTHNAALRIANRTHPEGLILVTDAIPAFGLEDGIIQMGDMMIEKRFNRAVVAGTETLVGSISGLDFCVRHFMRAARVSAEEAIDCATLHPAEFLGIEDRKGTLEFGTDADFVLLDDSLNVKATFVGGKLAVSNV